MTERVDARKKITPSISGTYFSVLVFCSLAVSVIFSLIVQYCGLKKDGYAYMILSYTLNPLSTMIITVVFITCLKLDVRQSLKIKNAKAKYYLLALLALAGCYTGLSSVNGYFNEFIQRISGKEPQIPQILPFSPLNYFITVFTVCVLPAIAEEAAFRGMIVGGLDGYNPLMSAAVTGFVFSLFHMNPAQTPYQFITGFAFSLLSICSESLYPTLIIHFLNNFITVNLYYFGAGFSVPQPVSILMTIIGVTAFAAFVVITVFDCKRKENGYDTKQVKIPIKFALPGIVTCAVVWIVSLI